MIADEERYRSCSGEEWDINKGTLEWHVLGLSTAQRCYKSSEEKRRKATVQRDESDELGTWEGNEIMNDSRNE